MGPHALFAGAWPREVGTGFASAAMRLSWPQDLSRRSPDDYATVYLEYGIRPRLTMGLDLGHSVSGQGKTVVFARTPLLTSDHLVASVELGFGEINKTPVIRPGLSLGRGIENAHGYGWLSLDARAEHAWQVQQTDWKLDLTFGTALPRNLTGILQIQTGLQAGDPFFARLAPSVVFSVTKATRIELGVTYGLVGDTSMGVMVGAWHSF